MKSTLFFAAFTVASLFSTAALADGHHRARHDGFATSKRGHGHYEQRTVQQWVPGRWVQVACHGGYRSEWQQGHYENTVQWVWVERHAGHHWARGNHSYGWR